MSNLDVTLYPIQFVVSRREPKSSDTNALVTAKVSDPQLKNSDKFVEVLTQCVTQWVKTTEAGKSCFEYASDDLNIGDLASCGDSELRKILAENGIHEFMEDLFEYCSPGDWAYDTPLVNADEIEEDYSEFSPDNLLMLDL